MVKNRAKNKVKERRRELGLTLKQLSDASGVPVSTIADIEAGAEPGVLAAIDIAEALKEQVPNLWSRY